MVSSTPVLTSLLLAAHGHAGRLAWFCLWTPCRSACTNHDPGCLRRVHDAAINEVRVRGESCGGEVTCVVRRCPKGLGAPVFDKLEAELAKAMMR